MSQLTTLKNDLKTAITSSTVVSKVVSYFPGLNWNNNVFYNSEPLIHQMNRGKKLICHYWREGANYSNDADGGAGTLLTNWNIELYCFRKPSVTLLRNEESFEEAMEDIFATIISSIRSTNGLNLSNSDDSRIERIDLAPHGFVYKTSITINNSWDNGNR